MATTTATTRLSRAEVLQLAKEVKEKSKKITIDPLVMASIAMIESSGDPKAYRFEPHLNEASAGLTQVLISTAQWLAKDLGFKEMGYPKTEKALYEPLVALYFCGAYLTWLSTYKKEKRSEEFVVRGYNGGPNGINLEVTLHYWNKYKKARDEIVKLNLRGAEPPTETPTPNHQPLVSSTTAAAAADDGGAVYIVKEGDTLWGISKTNGCTVKAIQGMNPDVDPSQLKVGQALKLPFSSSLKKQRRVSRTQSGTRKGCAIS